MNKRLTVAGHASATTIQTSTYSSWVASLTNSPADANFHFGSPYQQALQDLISQLAPLLVRNNPSTGGTSAVSNPPVTVGTEASQSVDKLRQIRAPLQRYRDLSSHGNGAEARKELEEIQRLAK